MKLDTPLPPWWRDLFAFTAPVPMTVADKIAAAGDAGLRAVCAVLDPAFGDRPMPHPTEDARGLCAKMLGRFARPELVPWIFEWMRAHGPDDPVIPYLADSLAACGPSAATAACDWFADSEPGDAFRPWLAEVAAHAGARTDESLAVLVRYLQDDPIHAAELLADYGDAAAVAALLVEFDHTVTEGADADPQVLTTIGEVVIALGGELGGARATRLRASEEDARRGAIQQRRKFIEKGGFGSIERPEPGDECPCESGAKYADCCAAVEAELAERHRLWTLRPRT